MRVEKYDTHKLKMDLIELRNKINLENKVYKHLKTNSYAFALGLDIKEKDICPNAFTPGVISSSPYSLLLRNVFDYPTLKFAFLEDWGALNISLDKESGEFKIAIFTLPINKDSEWCKDYLFLRQMSDGRWYYKTKNSIYITDKDYNNNVITSISKANFNNYKFNEDFSLKR